MCILHDCGARAHNYKLVCSSPATDEGNHRVSLWANNNCGTLIGVHIPIKVLQLLLMCCSEDQRTKGIH